MGALRGSYVCGTGHCDDGGRGSCEWVGVVEPPYTAQRRSAGWVEEGKMMWMDDSIPPVRTTSGVALSAEDLQSRNREWIALVRWEDPKDSASTKIYKLRLGESVYIDRLGTLTLLEVNPESISSGGMLGWAYRDNVDFDPGCLNAASVTRARGEKCNICDS